MPAFKLISMLIFFVLVGCTASHPLGIPDTQWQDMNTEQRLQAQQKQAELDRAAEQQRAADARAREAEAIRQTAELEARRRDARYGERVQCVFSDAEAHLGGKWRNVEPVAMDLVQGMEVAFNLVEPSGHTMRYRTVAYARFDGQTLSLCRDAGNDRRNPSACVRVLGTFADYRRGIDQRIDSERYLRGRLRCDLAPAQGAPGLHDYRR